VESLVQRPEPLKFSEFTPPTEHEAGRYLLRFARTEGDLDRVCALRYDVFNRELGEGLRASELTQRDRDRFDEFCQHLMVIDRKSGEVVGTYRLQVPEVARQGAGFYSAGEFDLSPVPTDILDQTVELGRACVALEHRSRKALLLLWQGLLSYIRFNRKRYFFGCSSLTSQDPLEGWEFYRYLADAGHIHPTLSVPCLPQYACEGSAPASAPKGIKVPQLFGIYLRYGAHVISPPAIDREFGTIDYLTLLDIKGVPDKVLAGFTV